MLSLARLFIGLLNKHLLGIYCVPMTVLSLGDPVVHELDAALLSWNKHAIGGEGNNRVHKDIR